MLNRGNHMAGLVRPERLNTSATRLAAAAMRANWGVRRHLRNRLTTEMARQDASIAANVARRA
jgi:hypothetical protein